MSAPHTPPRRPAKREMTLLNASREANPLNGGFRSRDPAIERALQLSTFEVNPTTCLLIPSTDIS